MEIRNFVPNEKVEAAVNLPLKRPHPDFGQFITRGTPGIFQTFEKYQGTRIAMVLFPSTRFPFSSRGQGRDEALPTNSILSIWSRT